MSNYKIPVYDAEKGEYVSLGMDASDGADSTEYMATFWSESENKFIYVPLDKLQSELLIRALGSNVRTFKNDDGIFEHTIQAPDPKLTEWPEEID